MNDTGRKAVRRNKQYICIYGASDSISSAIPRSLLRLWEFFDRFTAISFLINLHNQSFCVASWFFSSSFLVPSSIILVFLIVLYFNFWTNEAYNIADSESERLKYATNADDLERAQQSGINENALAAASICDSIFVCLKRFIGKYTVLGNGGGRRGHFCAALKINFYAIDMVGKPIFWAYFFP